MKKNLFGIALAFVVTAVAVAQPQVEQGKQQLKSGKYDEAIKSFRVALKVDAKNDQAWSWLAKAFFLSKMPDSAIVAATRAKTLNDENLDAYLTIAQSQLVLKNTTEATNAVRSGLKVKKDYEPLIRTMGQVYLAMDSADAATRPFTLAQDLDPKDVQVYNGLGDAYLKTGVTALSIANYQKSLELDSTQSDIWFKLARTHMRERQWNDAAEAFQKGLALNPDNDDARLELGDMYYRAKYWAFAAKWLQPYVQRHPEAKAVAMKYVESLYASRQYKQVIPEAEKLLKDSPKSPSLLRMLAYSNVDSKNYASAIKYYTALQSVDTLKADDFRKLAMSYLETKQDSLAADAIEQIFKTDTTNSALYSEAGAIYMKMKAWAKAADMFDKRLKSDPTNFSAISNYAICTLFAGDIEKAIEAYKKAISLKPDYAASYYLLGNCYLQLKKWDDASVPFQSYIKLVDTAKVKNVKELSSAYKFVGLSLLLDKKYEESAKYEKKAIEYYDNDDASHTWLGQSYHNLQSNDNYPNAREDAIKEYKKALKINPNNKEAKKLLEMLEPQ